MTEENYYILSLGGSIIVPDDVDASFISEFIDLIRKYVDKGYKFAIITGGGKVCRRYQSAARDINPSISTEEEDWIGIHVTRMNAHFLRIMFGELASDDIVTDPRDIEKTEKPVIIGAGWEPGWSTDYDAVLAAKQLGVKNIANLSNISHVYDSDPKENPNAEKKYNISWSEYRSIIPSDWKPGMNLPFDPKASEEAEKLGLKVAIMNGRLINNLDSYLAGDDFDGTIIHS